MTASRQTLVVTGVGHLFLILLTATPQIIGSCLPTSYLVTSGYDC